LESHLDCILDALLQQFSSSSKEVRNLSKETVEKIVKQTRNGEKFIDFVIKHYFIGQNI
jgi:hypothetical protein